LSKLVFRDKLSALKDAAGLKGKLSFMVPMSRYTTMRVGGAALAMYQPESLKDIIDFLRACEEKGIPLMPIGCGSNIIASDAGTKKVLIKLSAPFFRRIEVCKEEVNCGSGVLLAELCSAAEKRSLGACEFLAGIPGTVGGAVFQNAGAHGRSMSDIIKDVKVVDAQGCVSILRRNTIDFSYRRSGLNGLIIVGATLALKKRAKKSIINDISRYMERRLTTQDYTAPSAGCIFKNPAASSLTAAQLIEGCGLKGRRVGGASVSKKHANFIINNGNARARDVLRLIGIIKKRVNAAYGVELKEEVEIIE